MRRLAQFVIAFLFCASISYADSFSDIRTQVRRQVKDNGATLQRYSDDFINDLINEAQKDVVNRTWCILDAADLTLTSKTTYYDLQSNVIAIHQAYYTNASGDITTLDEVMERSVRQSNPDYEDSAGDVTEYFVRQSTSDANALEMGIRSVPASVTTESIRYHYFAQPTLLSSDSDVPFNGLEHLVAYNQILAFYASAHIYLIEGLIQRATSYSSTYEAGIEIMKDRIGDSPNYNRSFKSNIGR